MQKEEISLSYISGDIPGCVKNVSANLEVYTQLEEGGEPKDDIDITENQDSDEWDYKKYP